MRDGYHNISPAAACLPAVLTTTPSPITVDTLGFNDVTLVVYAGAGGITFTGTNKITYVLTESDDDSTYTAVADAGFLGVTGTSSGVFKSYTTAKAAADVVKVGYRGGKRYLQFTPTFGGTHSSGTAVAAIAVRGSPVVQPAT